MPDPLARASMDPSHRSLALALGAFDEALDGDTALLLATSLMRLSVALTSIARARGIQASPALELLAQMHDVATGQPMACI